MKTTQSPEIRSESIDIRLTRADQLFAQLDPSPLVERDLDDAVEEFLVDSALDKPPETRLTIRVHLQAPDSAADPAALAAAIGNYFGFMRDREGGRIRELLREGRRSLGAGLLFLALCTALGQSAYALVGAPAGAFLREGLLIIGWVANWRPIEIFLYDWRPMRRKQKVYARLAEAQVELCIDKPA